MQWIRKGYREPKGREGRREDRREERKDGGSRKGAAREERKAEGELREEEGAITGMGEER